MKVILVGVCFVLLVAAFMIWRYRTTHAREAHIRTYFLPKGLYDKLRERHPHLTLKDCQIVAQGLRQFFLAYLRSGHQHVSMPSQVVDDLWHEFILNTKSYQAFCRQAFGRFLHHTPAAALSDATKSNPGLRRCWWYVCREENINPRMPTRLPLLFALDAKLNIANGFRYAADCSMLRKEELATGNKSVTYCGGDFASASIDGGTDGFGDSAGSDAGGDSGGGCGGGCGGGGD